MCKKYVLSSGPILEHPSGDLALKDVTVFEISEHPEEALAFSSPEAALSAWPLQMEGDGGELMELPRRRGFGEIYSVHERGSDESRLIGVMIEECSSSV